ncbi:alanine racemase [Paraburkholderia aspalathi]|uniref:Alanine racemase n=1 Tax=Paraburkholderia aspalathi TaxID=1324617 RepID=A0A1I7EP19_9BURK|nr:alanine racemase [Paraburkholderia aspalathi]
MPRPIVAQIHHDAVSHNLSRVKHLDSRSLAWAVVKANAYGHGIDRVLPALANADGIARLCHVAEVVA